MSFLTEPHVDRRPNLFTPDFGQRPHMLVGRDELVASLREGLSAGPRDHRFTSLLLGPRGSGKTVILNLLGDAARESGWIVIPLDASTPGLYERVAEEIAWTQQAYEGVPDTSGDRIERTSLKLGVAPIEWQREAVREIRPRWGLRHQLAALADHAGCHDAAVLLVLDEMHSGERRELRRLAADVQHIVKNEQLPLAFLGAGLSEMKHTLLEDKRMTFFARCNREDVPPLDAVHAARFLSRTVGDAGGRFYGDALPALAEAAGSLPYKMQLVGHYAWLVADAPSHPIDDQAAEVATLEADRVMHERVALPAWHSLSDTEQSYLRRLVTLGGAATPKQIAAGVDAAPRTLGRVLAHLINAACVRLKSHGTVVIADVIGVSSLKQIIEEENLHSVDPGGAYAPPTRRRCNAWMPRSQARCLLTPGHAGGHRSR